MHGREVVHWHHAVNQVSGSIALVGYTKKLTAAELTEWSRSLAAVAREMAAEARKMKKRRK